MLPLRRYKDKKRGDGRVGAKGDGSVGRGRGGGGSHKKMSGN